MIFRVEYQVLGTGIFSTAPFPRPTITKLLFFAEIAIESSNALEHELSRRCRASDRNHYPQPVPALVSLQHSLLWRRFEVRPLRLKLCWRYRIPRPNFIVTSSEVFWMFFLPKVYFMYFWKFDVSIEDYDVCPFLFHFYLTAASMQCLQFLELILRPASVPF